MRHRLDFAFRDGHFHEHGIVLVALHEPVDVAIERGREQKRLVFGFRCVQDRLDLGHEAHVRHLVGLIEHDHLDGCHGDERRGRAGR